MELFVTITAEDTFIFGWSTSQIDFPVVCETPLGGIFLVELNAFLQTHNKHWSDVASVRVVFGGLRFSVARIVSTVINTLSLAYGFAVTSESGDEKIAATDKPRYLIPLYKYPPHIGTKNS